MIYNATIYNDSWNTKKLYELGDFSRGKSKHRPRNDPKLFDNGEYPLVQTGDIKAATLYVSKHEAAYNEFGLSQSKLWPTGTLCITIAANIAETGILAYPMCFPDSIVGFTANQAETSEQFMHYIFTYIRQSIQNSVSGSIQDNINIEYLKSLDFKIPEKSYQDKIVSVLSGLDEKIELNSKICSELETMSKTLYDYWFVQFDFPDENGKPYRTSGGEMVWNEQLKREIPRGWEAIEYSELVDIENSSINPSSFGETVMEHYSIPAFDEDCMPAFDTADTIQSGKYRVLKETFLVSKLNPQFRRIWNPYCLTDNAICSTEFMVYKPKDITLRPICYAIANSDGFYNHMVSKAISSTGSRKRIQPDVSIKYSLAFPLDRFVVDRFCSHYGPIMEKIKKTKLENYEFKKLRDWLLPMLMNGQARVE